tara:strand:- start:284 stop:583 length:300 start_codon:yes stop_codon:yes gene_type:complete
MALDLGLGTIISLASEVFSDNAAQKTGASDAYRKAANFRFSDDVYRGMDKPTEAGEVKANEAVSYEDLTRMWDSILPNAYAEIIRTQEQPAYRSKKEII